MRGSWTRTATNSWGTETKLLFNKFKILKKSRQLKFLKHDQWTYCSSASGQVGSFKKRNKWRFDSHRLLGCWSSSRALHCEGRTDQWGADQNLKRASWADDSSRNRSWSAKTDWVTPAGLFSLRGAESFTSWRFFKVEQFTVNNPEDSWSRQPDNEEQLRRLEPAKFSN